MTNDLARRVAVHRQAQVDGFTKRYQVHRLVWFEAADNPSAAIVREKQIKNWKRAWKIRLIEEMNPAWKDLFDEIVG